METSKERVIRALRIALGIVLSIVIAEALGVKFAASTGIIALLGIQSTTKETMKTVLVRIVSFGYTVLFSVLVHEFIGVGAMEFTIVVLLVTVVSMALNWEKSLSINIVIAVHLFMQSEPFSWALIGNESIRLIIGVTVAVLVDLRRVSKEDVYEQLIIDVEDHLKRILLSFSKYLVGTDSLDDIKVEMQEYSSKIQEGVKDTYLYVNNNLLPHAMYYQSYMKMREKEYVILENVYELFGEFGKLPPQGAILASHLEEISEEVPVHKPMDKWLQSFDTMKKEMDAESLPTSREEFKDDATLYFIIRELEKMIYIKQDFIHSLTKSQLERYHHEIQ